ncbi:MAG: helix-turn-helix transcriptional regulator [Gemmatimonadota bacterium]
MHPTRSTATTDEILGEIGQRLRRFRLQQNRTLGDVAREAGISYRTAQRAEAGKNPTLETLIRLLRALGRLDALDTFLPPALVSPIQLAQLSGQERQRAGTPRRGGRPRLKETDG